MRNANLNPLCICTDAVECLLENERVLASVLVLEERLTCLRVLERRQSTPGQLERETVITHSDIRDDDDAPEQPT
jgi:hypothetical protein